MPLQREKFRLTSSLGRLDTWTRLTSHCLIIKSNQIFIISEYFGDESSLHSVCKQIKERLWLEGRAHDTLPAHHCSAPPRGGTVAGLQPRLSATVAASARVELREGCQVSTTLGQQSSWRRAAAAEPCIAAGLEAPVDNICHRGRTICPGPGLGDHLSPLRPEAGPPPPDLDLSSCAEADAKKAAKTQSALLKFWLMCLTFDFVSAAG